MRLLDVRAPSDFSRVTPPKTGMPRTPPVIPGIPPESDGKKPISSALTALVILMVMLMVTTTDMPLTLPQGLGCSVGGVSGWDEGKGKGEEQY